MTKYDLYAEGLLNWRAEYEEYLKDPDYYLFLNNRCFTKEETERFKAAIANRSKMLSCHL